MASENLDNVRVNDNGFGLAEEDEQKYRIKTLITTKFFKNFDDMDLGIVQVANDRIPRVLQVRDLDIICFIFAMLTYCLDMYTDVLTAGFHAAHERYASSIAIIGITIFSSLVLTVVSRNWMLKSDIKYHASVPAKRLIYRLDNEKYISYNTMKVFLLFQAGPVYWLYKAFYFAIQFRKYEHIEVKKRYYFKKMVEAERDASILRIIEAFLESAPQLVVQGVIAYKFIFLDKTRQEIPLFFLFQCFSMLVSVISLTWAIIVQNRSFRMFRDDKLNLWPREIILMFLWRFFTIFARIWVIVIATVSKDAFFFYGTHFVVTYLHVVILQPVEMKTKRHEYGAAAINTIIHYFAPMNIAEGPTKWRYAVAYVIEFFEMIFILDTMFLNGTRNEYRVEISCLVSASFLIGITFMVVYHCWFHPNIRHARKNQQKQLEAEKVEENQEIQKPENEEIELAEVSLACEAMRLAGDVINVIHES